MNNFIYLMPNPANHSIRVLGNEGMDRLQIINTNGRVCQEEDHIDAVTNIDITSLSTGIYIIKATINGEVLTTKFIKI